MAVILLIKNLNKPLGTSRAILQRADFDGLLPDRDRTELVKMDPVKLSFKIFSARFA